MGKPVWQRARYTSIGEGAPAWLIGAEFWVKTGPPEAFPTVHQYTGEPLPARPRYVTHRVGWNGTVLAYAAATELLARSPDDFADDVKLVDYEDWKRDALARKEQAQ